MFATVLGFEECNKKKNLTRGMLAALQQGYCIRINAHHWKCSRGHSKRHWDSWGDGTWATCNTMAVPCQLVSRHVRVLLNTYDSSRQFYVNDRAYQDTLHR